MTVRSVAIALVLIAALALTGCVVEMVLDLGYSLCTESPPIAPMGAAALAPALTRRESSMTRYPYRAGVVEGEARASAWEATGSRRAEGGQTAGWAY